MGTNVRVLYCTSWSYKGNFLNLKKYIEQVAPEVSVEGGEYPPGTGRQLAAKIVKFVQMGFLGLIIAGENIFQVLGQPLPAFLSQIQGNKWGFGMGAWFIGSQLSTTLVSTGAFEIYVNENLEYSKLNLG